MNDCELLPRRGFFAKYQSTSDLACRGFMASYCQGPGQVQCKRRQFRAQHGLAPDDDMLPTGQMMPKAR
jgi:hypothetical protein